MYSFLALGYIFLGIPLLLAGYFETEKSKAIFYTLFALNFLVGVLPLFHTSKGREIFETRYSPVLTWTALYLLYLLPVTLYSIVTIRYNFEINQLNTLIGTYLWFLPAFGLTRLIRSEREITLSRSFFNYSMLMLSGSVYLALLGGRFGFSFGEVLHYNDGTVRFFGLLGDQVSFVVLGGLFVSIIEKKVGRVLFHSGAVLLTGTRGALGSLAAGVGLYIVLGVLRGDPRYRLRRFVYGLGLVGIMVGILFGTSLGAALTNRFIDTVVFEDSVSTRLTSMKIGIDAFMSAPIFGLGVSGFPIYVSGTNVQNLFRAYLVNYTGTTSNQVIQVAVEGGVVGVILFLVTLLSIFRAFKSDARIPQAFVPLQMGGLLWAFSLIVANQTAVWFSQECLSGLILMMLAVTVEKARALAPTVSAEHVITLGSDQVVQDLDYSPT